MLDGSWTWSLCNRIPGPSRRGRFLLDRLLVARPKALVEAARMLIKDQAAIVHVLSATAIPIPGPSAATWIETWPLWTKQGSKDLDLGKDQEQHSAYDSLPSTSQRHRLDGRWRMLRFQIGAQARQKPRYRQAGCQVDSAAEPVRGGV